MKGELLAVWSAVWSEVWIKLYETKGTPIELFSELYDALIPKPKSPPPPSSPVNAAPNGELIDPADIAALEQYQGAQKYFELTRARYEEAVNATPDKARIYLRDDLPKHVNTEADAIAIFEKAFKRIDDIGGDALSNKYFNLVAGFLEKYSIRYDLRRPFTLHPTLAGLFTQLLAQLKLATKNDTALFAAMQDFEESIRDLRDSQTPAKIKTCISKQVNLLESFGRKSAGVTGTTLGAICDQVGTWPHMKVRDSMKNLYGFASDYPGIRHGGTPANQIREIEMRDLVAISVLLAGFTPYLTDLLDSNAIYGGGS